MIRHVFLALTIALAPATALAQADSVTSWPEDVGPGRVAWFDITTSDLAKSKEFYGRMFGWSFKPLQGTDLAVEIVHGNRGIGTLRVASGPIGMFNGVVYVQVDDVEASCRKAAELGASVVPGFPFNLSNGTGAVGLVSDPVGHPLGLYSRTPIGGRRSPS